MFYDWRDVEKIQVLNLLKQIKELFSDPSTWIDWPIATDQTNNEVNPQSMTAAHFSLMGACEKFSVIDYPSPLCNFVSCATRDFLDDLSDDKRIKNELSYDDEFALICLAIEDLEKEIREGNVTST